MNNKIEILNLGFHPYADTFIEKKYLGFSEPIYQLACVLNTNNFLIENKIKTSDFDRYNLYDYSYTSSNSEYSKNYWKNYSQDILNYLKKTHKTRKKLKVLEVGSNDGYLLSQFHKKGFSVLGVDASKKMCQIAKKKELKL